MINGLFVNTLILNTVFIWYIFIIFCILITIVLTTFLYRHSKKPEKLDHKSYLNKKNKPGILKDLSENIKNEKKLKQYRSSIKNTIVMMFYQKIGDKEQLTKEKILKIKGNDPEKFYQLINDKDIYNFIQNFDENKINKEKYLKEINVILDKMEAWEWWVTQFQKYIIYVIN